MRRRAATAAGAMRVLAWLAGAGAAVALSAAELPADQVEFFEAKIRPLLVEHCYKCHSAESGKSKGSLTLDSRDALRKGGGTGPALVPGEPDRSLLIEAVRYASDDLQMPPKEEGGRLPAEKVALLEAWVKMGAPDPRVGEVRAGPLDLAKARRHWAFQPVTRPALPPVRAAKAVATPVDAFVLAKLEGKKLRPAPPADPRTLLRRVTYDLTGLPPTPAEMDAFLADRDPGAYAKVVERLLASPRYGERWGRYWLDVARYADTKGYLAGNVERRYGFSYTYRDYVIRAFNEDRPLDRFIVEQLAADHVAKGEDKSALAAMGFLTLGRRFLNNQNDIIDDRIDVISRGLLGLTVTCARCHDHKFDPVSSGDYYALHGVFASSEEPAEKPLLGPLVDSPAYQEFLRKRAAIEAKIKGREDDEVKKFLTGVREKTGDYLLAVHDAPARPKTEKIDVFAGVRKLNPEVLKRWQAFLAAPERETDPVLAPWRALAAIPPEQFAGQAQALIAGWKAPADDPGAAAAPITPTFNPLVVAALVQADSAPTALGDVARIYNRLFADAESAWQAATAAAATSALPDPAQEQIRQILYAAGAPANVGAAEAATMLKRQIDTKVSGLRREMEALNWTEAGAPQRAMALLDRETPRNSRIFIRGNPANPGPEAPRQFLAVLATGQPRPLTRGSGRLDLAEEIVSPQNPLTARVFVNRVWGWHFGEALVRTPSDFGIRTTAPVQLDLLDWLAASFVESGWSAKALHRWIVLSHTYRQAAEGSAAAAQADPDNLLVHRFGRRRLDLEAMRDTLLAVAGTLDLRAGGLPDDVGAEPFSGRRTVYGYIDRQSLPGMFRTFDYPNPDVSSAQRFATTVPQQALFLMNSPFVQHQAREFLRRPELAAARTDREKVQAAYRLIFQRAPDREEFKLAFDFLQHSRGPAERLPDGRSGWQYGHGRYDEAAGRVADFQLLTVRRDGRFSPGERYPDARLGHLSVTATGGHPGPALAQASIRRWLAPGPGRVRIEGMLGHEAASGDGVHARIVAAEGGTQGEWTAHRRKVETKCEFEVRAGETVDFVVDCRADDNSDTYTWAPTLAFTPGPEAIDLTPRTWNARKDFENSAQPRRPLTRWEELVQVWLLSNELAFLD